MKYQILRHLPTMALTVALWGTTYATQAQDAAEPAPDYVTQTTTAINIPDGGSIKEFNDLYKEYFAKVISKNVYFKHFSLLRHFWGSEGASIVRVVEYADWSDIEKAVEETKKLEKAAWPDDTARAAFFKKFGSYQDPHHSDEIYTVLSDFTK